MSGKNPKIFACGGLGGLDSLVPCPPYRNPGYGPVRPRQRIFYVGCLWVSPNFAQYSKELGSVKSSGAFWLSDSGKATKFFFKNRDASTLVGGGMSRALWAPGQENWKRHLFSRVFLNFWTCLGFFGFFLGSWPGKLEKARAQSAQHECQKCPWPPC